MPKNSSKGVIIISLAGILFLVFLVLNGPIEQSASYHHFEDTKSYFGISNFLNVFSNIGFFIIGSLGLRNWFRGSAKLSLPVAYGVFFIGIILTGIGSAYYHLQPENSTLLWDRLPMTITFMALFSLILSLHVDDKIGKKVLIPFLLSGVFSACYWYIGEQNGIGDLRPYVFVQFFPMIAIPILCLANPLGQSSSKVLFPMIGFYLVAKVFEHFDGELFQLLGNTISGHTLKHVFAALASYPIVRIMSVYRK